LRPPKSLRRLRASVPAGVLWALAGGVLLFLYLPVAVILAESFNASPIASFPIHTWTTNWYSVAAHDADIVSGVRNSLVVAGTSLPIAMAVGIPAAFGLNRFDFPGKGVIERVLFLPFLLPGIISGVTLLTIFLDLGLTLSLKTVIVGHITMLVPLTIVLMSLSLRRWDRDLESAAMDLGANEWRTFVHVVLPNLRSAIAGIVLLGLTFSLDEITRTFFLSGTQNTLPMTIWAMLRRGITPEVNAVAAVILAVSLLTIGLWSRISKDIV
jgi:spermidine/putrescine transport system permease protein